VAGTAQEGWPDVPPIAHSDWLAMNAMVKLVPCDIVISVRLRGKLIDNVLDDIGITWLAVPLGELPAPLAYEPIVAVDVVKILPSALYRPRWTFVPTSFEYPQTLNCTTRLPEILIG